MDKLKQWVALTVVAALAILAAGWFLVVSPKRVEAADLRAQAAAQRSANAQLSTQIDVLKAQSRNLPKEQAKLAAVAAKIPRTPELPVLVRALLTASTNTGVELVSITPGQPTPIGGPATAGAAAAPGQPPKPAAAGSLASIPVSISINGDYFESAAFVSALEKLPRALRVSNLSMKPGVSPTADPANKVDLEKGSSLTTTISGVVFMATDAPAASAPSAGAPASAAN